MYTFNVTSATHAVDLLYSITQSTPRPLNRYSRVYESQLYHFGSNPYICAVEDDCTLHHFAEEIDFISLH